MKRFALNLMSLTALAATVFVVACDWESGSQVNYNSRVNNVSISGFYEGQLPGGRAVSNTSNGTILNFAIQQSGNSITVRDNQGSRYKGTITAPDVRSDLSSDSLLTGMVVVAYQIGFSGKDNVAAREIEFSGNLILGTLRTVQANASGGASNSASERDTVTGPIVDGDTTTSSSSESSRTSQSSSSNSFELNETNASLRLRGTWIEQGGVVSNVNAVAPMNDFTITSGF